MKQKRLKKYESEDSSEIRNLIIITVILPNWKSVK